MNSKFVTPELPFSQQQQAKLVARLIRRKKEDKFRLKSIQQINNNSKLHKRIWKVACEELRDVK